MDACVRNGSYDDALDLRAFVRKLAVMHGDLGMAQRLLGEATAVADTMLRQLLARLRTNIQLPECLRVIGFLRRLEAFPEQVGGSSVCLHVAAVQAGAVLKRMWASLLARSFPSDL